MNSTGDDPSTQAVAALLEPLARLMIDGGIPLSGAVELLKIAFVSEALRRDPDAHGFEPSLEVDHIRGNDHSAGSDLLANQLR